MPAYGMAPVGTSSACPRIQSTAPQAVRHELCFQSSGRPRDMRRELEEWRESRRARRATASVLRGPSCSGGLIRSKALLCETAASAFSAPVTPARQRAHVNAVSPLDEICHGAAGGGSGSRGICARGTAAAAAASMAAVQLQAAGAAPGAVTAERPTAAGKREPGLDSMDSAARSSAAVAAALVCLEERLQVPRPPPSSPSTPFADRLGRLGLAGASRMATPQNALATALAALEAATGCSPGRPRGGHASPADAEEPEAAQEEWGLQVAKEEAEDEAPEAAPGIEDLDSLELWHRWLERHAVVWPPPTVLDMEDHLSRAYDIFIFWFFEARDRANTLLPESAQRPPEPLACIPEYPLDWPQWRIDSFELREAARAARGRAAKQRKEVLAEGGVFGSLA